MKIDIAVSGARRAAEKLFATQDALRLVPPPCNESIDDLRAHVRRVVFGRGRSLLAQFTDRRVA